MITRLTVNITEETERQLAELAAKHGTTMPSQE